MIPVILAGIIVFIVSVEIQPENLTTLVSDMITVTLSKDNLKRVTVADVEKYLPPEIKSELPPAATIEDVVPIAFNNITGLDSYISMESVEQMIEDDVIKDVATAILNERDYDFVSLADKYHVQLQENERSALSQLKTSAIKQELSNQGYDIDEIITEQATTTTTTPGTSGQSSELSRLLALLNPVLIFSGLFAAVVVFYLLLSLIWWDFKSGLIYWGSCMLLIGVSLLVFNGIKMQLLEIGIATSGADLNLVLFGPAIDRLARPILWSGIISSAIGVGAIAGGIFWRKATKPATAAKPSKKPAKKSKNML